MIRSLLANIRDTLTGVAGGGDETELRSRSEQRHSLVESWLERRGRILSMVPMIVIFAVASTNMVAAIWAAFGVELFLILLDFYRSRYNPRVAFPNIISVALMSSYIVCIVLFYVLNPPLQSVYVSPIVLSCVTGAMLLSLVFMYPFTIQNSAHRVDEATRASLLFYRFNQIITVFWLLIMACACGSSWGSLQFSVNSAGQIILGIVLPLLFILTGFIATPYLVEYIKSRAPRNSGASTDKKNDEESTTLLEKA
jgi:hypothetical protein